MTPLEWLVTPARVIGISSAFLGLLRARVTEGGTRLHQAFMKPSSNMSIAPAWRLERGFPLPVCSRANLPEESSLKNQFHAHAQDSNHTEDQDSLL